MSAIGPMLTSTLSHLLRQGRTTEPLAEVVGNRHKRSSARRYILPKILAPYAKNIKLVSQKKNCHGLLSKLVCKDELILPRLLECFLNNQIRRLTERAPRSALGVPRKPLQQRLRPHCFI
jgi:hypothetical protein